MLNFPPVGKRAGTWRDGCSPSSLALFPNIFWRNTRTEKHHPDPLDTSDPPPVVLPVSRRGCTCEFCECVLAPSGEVMRMGDKAKNFRRHDDTVEKKDAEIARLGAEITALKEEVTRLKVSSGTTGGSGHRPGSRVQ